MSECQCPRTDGYRIKRRNCPVHAEGDAKYWAWLDDVHPHPEPPSDVTEDEVARVLWEASRADEGTISAIGAVHAARAVLAAFHVTRRDS